MQWVLDDGRIIRLLTLEEFNKLTNGTKLISIFGEEIIKAPTTDSDTRGGFVAYGFLLDTKSLA